MQLILAGIGRGSAQVLYHQQQRAVATRMQQSSGPGTPQHGYSTQQPIQTVAAGYGPQQNAPAYTTQSQQQVCRYNIHPTFSLHFKERKWSYEVMILRMYLL